MPAADSMWRQQERSGWSKLLSVKHFRQGVRMEMVAGGRAMRILHQHKTAANSQVAAALSVKRGRDAGSRPPSAGRDLRPERADHTFPSGAFCSPGRAMRRKRQCSFTGTGTFQFRYPKRSDAVLTSCGGICAVISLEGNGQGKGGSVRYAVGQRDGDVRALVQEMNGKLQGRGGGRPFFAQGSLQAEREQIRTFFAGKGFRVLCEKSSY